MKVSKEPLSARDIVYDIQRATECIRRDKAEIDRLFEELQALVDGPKNESANDTPDIVQKMTFAALHDHNPVQHRDGKEPWCNICFKTADGRDPDYHIDAVARPRGVPAMNNQTGRGGSISAGYLKLEVVTEPGNSTEIETIRKFDELTIETNTIYDDDRRFSNREPIVIGSEMTIKLVWYGETPTHVERHREG